MKGVIIFTIFLILMFCPMVISLVTCNPNYISTTYNEGENPTRTIQCTNDANYSVGISKIGSFSIDTNIIGQSPSTKTILITFDSVTSGSGTINFNDSSTPIPIIYNVNPPQPTSLISFPTSKIINVQQGSSYQKKITLIMPSSYPNPINIQSIEFSEYNEIISFGDLETGVINPGDTKDIPLIINSIDAQVGEYPTISVLVRFDDDGEIVTLSSALTIIVTANLNPTTNITFSTKPSCSLSASVMYINDTYSFTCSNVQKNLEVSPVYNSYFEGLTAQLSGSIYTYEFKPLKYGNTNFVSTFRYLGAPLFSPFEQEVKIQSSGSGVPGTDLKFKFTPELDNLLSEEECLIQLIDNKTGSLVNSPEIYINAIKLGNLNSSENSFPFKFKSGTNYEIRGKAEGYNDLVQTINISETQIELSITPSKTQYSIGDKVNITSNVNETIFLLDNEVINGENYEFEKAGNLLLEGKKEGCYTSNKSLDVLSSVSYLAMSPTFDKWKVGKDVVIELDEITNWKVEFYKEIEDIEGNLDYSDKPQIIEEDKGDRVEFSIDERGIYEVKSGNKLIVSKTIEKRDWFGYIKFWEYGWVGWIIFLVIFLGGGWFLLPNNKKSNSGELNLTRTIS